MKSKEREELLNKLLLTLKELEVEEAHSIESPKSPHFWWLICLMGAAVVALLATIFCFQTLNGEHISNYVSAFSVMLSIVLSIFAIQYTYHSNAQVERQFNDINRAARNIIETSKELKETESLLKSSIERIHDHLKSNDIKIDKLSSIVNNLENQIKGNPSFLYKKGEPETMTANSSEIPRNTEVSKTPEASEASEE